MNKHDWFVNHQQLRKCPPIIPPPPFSWYETLRSWQFREGSRWLYMSRRSSIRATAHYPASIPSTQSLGLLEDSLPDWRVAAEEEQEEKLPEIEARSREKIQAGAEEHHRGANNH